MEMAAALCAVQQQPSVALNSMQDAAYTVQIAANL
jgi:hypothetical protein